MKASLKNRIKFFILDRMLPCWRVSGRRVIYFSDDYHELQICLPYKRINRGPHGYTYGGSIFSAVDAIPAFQYFLILGREYIVWDKQATIKFKRPCRGPLFVSSTITRCEISEIKTILTTTDKFERKYSINLVDENEVVHVEVEKIIHFRKNNKQGSDKNNQTRNRLL